jgi:hypothetical protein
MAASATFALKAGEWFRRARLLMVSPVHGDYRRCQAETPPIVLCRFPGPALKAIIDLLKPLDEMGRSRVLEYVLKRLDMAAFQSEPAIGAEPVSAGSSVFAGGPVKDIRAFTAEKQPRSANEMVALIAYYLSDLAPATEASATVNVEMIRKYFKLANFPMPRVVKNALTNAAAAGYLESVSRGEYRLNSVGHNLVVHGLPRNGASGTDKMRRKR